MSARAGEAPQLSTEGPQRQLDQRSSPELWGRLVHEVFARPGVVEGHSAVSPASSRAVFLSDLNETTVAAISLAPPEHRLEPVHLHGVDDTSLHLCLPPEVVEEVVRDGWGVPHQYGDHGTEMLLYGPRDETELAVVLGYIDRALRWAADSA